jgi:integrase/recombinase XerD
LFPGRFGGYFQPDSADNTLRKACKLVGLIGVSSHSFRRTALTLMSDNHVPLRVIQEVSGHRNLEQLQAYIEVRDEQVLGAVTGLSMLSPLPQAEKYRYTGEFNKPMASSVSNKLECILNKLRKKGYGITKALRSPLPPEMVLPLDNAEAPSEIYAPTLPESPLSVRWHYSSWLELFS